MKSEQSWDNYWTETQNKSGQKFSAIKSELVERYWQNEITQLDKQFLQGNVIEIACGNGELLNQVIQLPNISKSQLYATDISLSALINVKERLNVEHRFISDAAKLPLENQQFSLIMSRYGSEYAGKEAFSEMLRIAAPTAQVMLLMHSVNGEIYQECKRNFDAINDTISSSFFPLTRDLFQSAFSVMKGADQGLYQQSASNFLSAKSRVEHHITQFGTNITAGFLPNILNQILDIHDRIEYYNSVELDNWLAKLELDIEAYKARMKSMLNAALSENDFDNLKRKFETEGFEIMVGKLLQNKQGRDDLGWVFTAKRTL